MYESRTPVQQQVSSVEQLKEKKSGKVSQRRFNDQRPEFSNQQAIQKMANDHRVQQDVVSAKTQGGLPMQLKQGVEQLSGISMNDVKVHYNSSQPAQLQAHAYAQGSHIHLGPGQEKHLPHEAWHVVQQKQGRVQPTIQMKSGVPVNDSPVLEKEADVMGAKAMQAPVQRKVDQATNPVVPFHSRTVQRFVGERDDNTVTEHGIKYTSDGHDRVTKAEGSIQIAPPNSGRGEAQGRTTQVVSTVYSRLFSANNNFNGGHILAHHHGGSAGMQNMVPFEAYYNQHGGYKLFENSVDNALALANHQNQTTSLSVNIEVDYPQDTLMGVLVGILGGDAYGRIPLMQANPAASAAIRNAFRRIPTAVRMTRCTDGVSNFLGNIVQPTNPRTPLVSNTRHNASAANVATGDQASRTHIYGPGRVTGETEDVDSDYHADIKERYKHMPKPGIMHFLPAVNGFAGGVFAYIWMDPLGTQDKFGGTATEDGTIPLGSDWPILHQGVNPAGGGAAVWRKGHYLNAQLHGPGHDSRNLVPITGSANGLMAVNFENLVKRSAALTNPDKGIFVIARGIGAVARPGNWQRNDAVAAGSTALWDAENNLPQTIVLRAVEGRMRADKIPEMTGTVVAQANINNYLNPGDGNLGRTELPLGHPNVATGAGALANRTHRDYETKRLLSGAALTRDELNQFGVDLDGAAEDDVIAITLRYGNTPAKKTLMIEYLRNQLDYQGVLHRVVNDENKTTAIYALQGIPRLRGPITGNHGHHGLWKGPGPEPPPGGGASGHLGRTEITA